MLNSDDSTLLNMNAGLTRLQLWQHFEDSIRCVIILWTATHACILKAYDPNYSHFIGLLETVKPLTLPVELVKKYAFSERPCYLYEIAGENNFVKFEYWKLTDATLAWAGPLCSN